MEFIHIALDGVKFGAPVNTFITLGVPGKAGNFLTS